MNVTAPTGCTWTAVSNDTSWISVDSGNSGNGNGTVRYSFAQNDAKTPRAGTITIAGQTFTIIQAANTCTYTLSPASYTVGYDFGSGSVNVTTQTDCCWTATADVSWIEFTTRRGCGSTSAGYDTGRNLTSSSRTGTITIGGQNVTVTQEGL